MFDKKLYYRKWNAEHREQKRIWMWNKRHSIENLKSEKVFIPHPIELPEHSTGSKRKCCWCGNNPEIVYCSKQCEHEAKKLGVKDIETITPEFANTLMAG